MKYGLRCLSPSKAWYFFKKFVERKGLILRELREQGRAWGAGWGSGSGMTGLEEQDEAQGAG